MHIVERGEAGEGEQRGKATRHLGRLPPMNTVSKSTESHETIEHTAPKKTQSGDKGQRGKAAAASAGALTCSLTGHRPTGEDLADITRPRTLRKGWLHKRPEEQQGKRRHQKQVSPGKLMEEFAHGGRNAGRGRTRRTGNGPKGRW